MRQAAVSGNLDAPEGKEFFFIHSYNLRIFTLISYFKQVVLMPLCKQLCVAIKSVGVSRPVDSWFSQQMPVSIMPVMAK